MVQIVSGGVAAFDANVYVPPQPDTVEYLQTTMNNYFHRLGEPARQLYQTVADRITGYDYEKLGYMMQAVGRTVQNMWMDNVIQPLYEVGQMQHAPQVMVRWLMAEPTIRQLYHNGEAEGYGDRYVDYSPGLIGEEHLDWQIVNDGVIHEDEEGVDYCVDYFYDSDPRYDPEYDNLNVNDVANIMRTWTHMAAYAEAKLEDPTSKWNAQL